MSPLFVSSSPLTRVGTGQGIGVGVWRDSEDGEASSGKGRLRGKKADAGLAAERGLAWGQRTSEGPDQNQLAPCQGVGYYRKQPSHCLILTVEPWSGRGKGSCGTLRPRHSLAGSRLCQGLTGWITGLSSFSTLSHLASPLQGALRRPPQGTAQPRNV